MRALVLDPAPVELTALLERRHRLGLDLRDEVWKGVLHVNPGPHGRHHRVQQQLAELLGPPARAAGLTPAIGNFNLGSEDDYRVPDGGLHRPGPDEMYYATAALAVEIASPEDETWQKLPFYASHGVDELLIVDPQARAVHWFALGEDTYEPVERSALVEMGAAELADRIEWP